MINLNFFEALNQGGRERLDRSLPVEQELNMEATTSMRVSLDSVG